jgi:hypothetical protein
MKIKDKVSGRFIPHKLEDRFWEKVDKKDSTSCWLWKGYLNRTGYGRFRVGKENKQATATSWFVKYGVWPTLCMCHTCDNPTCVNPSHLFEGTHLDNARDKVNKGRGAFGSRNGTAKTNEEIVAKIKHELLLYGDYYGVNQVLAKKYNVNHSTVSKIKKGKHWAHV